MRIERGNPSKRLIGRKKASLEVKCGMHFVETKVWWTKLRFKTEEEAGEARKLSRYDLFGWQRPVSSLSRAPIRDRPWQA